MDWLYQTQFLDLVGFWWVIIFLVVVICGMAICLSGLIWYMGPCWGYVIARLRGFTRIGILLAGGYFSFVPVSYMQGVLTATLAGRQLQWTAKDEEWYPFGPMNATLLFDKAGRKMSPTYNEAINQFVKDYNVIIKVKNIEIEKQNKDLPKDQQIPLLASITDDVTLNKVLNKLPGDDPIRIPSTFTVKVHEVRAYLQQFMAGEVSGRIKTEVWLEVDKMKKSSAFEWTHLMTAGATAIVVTAIILVAQNM